MSLEKRRKQGFVVILICLVAALALFLWPGKPGSGPLPNFADLESQARKAAFFDYLLPIVEDRNAEIQRTRDWVLQVLDAETMNWLDAWRWRRLAGEYRVSLDQSDVQVASALRRRVDRIPASLILAQAAKESGWGRSRFARVGNAVFGERCFEAGCGIVPQGRAAGARHEVRSFDSVADSVESYLLNLNSHERYAELRRERERLSDQGLAVRGSALAPFMTFYSERGEAYVDDILALISYNDLEPPAPGDAR
ncbi:MAG: glucosaminidase domain-containing protein [Gammaproteobacteria bacterium]|nr:glucosaminidase domain-containing protein [Gammaproteobacteria bacterium]